jgi:polyisoprenyl-teichoic acid--peptidoglycan teichoic acid transferase
MASNDPKTPQTPYYYQMSAPPPLPMAQEQPARRRRPRRSDGWAWVVIAAALVSVAFLLSMFGLIFVRALQGTPSSVNIASAGGDNGGDPLALPTAVDLRGTAAAGIDFDTGQQITLDDGRSIILTPWDGQSRFTMLVMGIDRRPNESGLSFRTDTMMLVSLDPINQTIGMLSIPRDLFVEVPGYGQLQRVNTPMVLGELQQPGYGPRLAMQTVQYNLGMRVHDYLVVDFNAFITLVDVIGGVTVETTYTIDDPGYPDLYYGYDPYYLAAGTHHLNGYEALRFARTRHGSSDLERALRQQQVIQAIRTRILDLNLLPSLIVQAPSMYDNLSDDIATGLTLDQMIELAWYVKDIPRDNIRSGVIDARYTFNYTTPDNAQVLVPDRSALGQLMVEVFGENYAE